uniref:Putative ovule protein n=1 Tax=Solanum chacoense TaxID=4108 RepID=A0A0V0H545_SOLCH
MAEKLILLVTFKENPFCRRCKIQTSYKLPHLFPNKCSSPQQKQLLHEHLILQNLLDPYSIVYDIDKDTTKIHKQSIN